MFKSAHRFPYCLQDYLNPKYYYYYVRHCVERIRYGVSRKDEWSFDDHLVNMLLYSLPKYKNDGEYGGFVKFGPWSSGFGSTESSEEAMDMWDAMIDAIWSALYDMYVDNDDWEKYLDYQYSKEGAERTELAMEVFARMFRGLWW